MYKKTAAVILAGGRGKRIGGDTPKQYLEIGGHPLIYYSLKAFSDSFVDEIYLVCGEGDEEYCSTEIVEKNLKKIKQKYPNINIEEMKIISSYTCESKDKNLSPYKLLNKNLVEENRNQGINNISKYLYIFLKTLRKLERYYPDDKSKYLYRCINSKVSINEDVFNPKLNPYIVGKTKKFWGFTSTSPLAKITYNFLKEENTSKSGTIFTLAGKVWGYDISLFNYFNENEILLEPETEFIIDEVLPPLNGIIHIRCDVQDSPLVLLDFPKKNKNEKKDKKEKGSNNEYDLCIFKENGEIPNIIPQSLKYIFIGDNCKYSILSKYIISFISSSHAHDQYLATIKLKKDLYNIDIYDLECKNNFESMEISDYEDADCILIIYDISNRMSFEYVPLYMEKINEITNDSTVVILVGDKGELENERKIFYEEGKSLADNYNIKFYEVSHVTGENINKILYDSLLEVGKYKNPKKDGKGDSGGSKCYLF
mgnify:CR=1 FL=1